MIKKNLIKKLLIVFMVLCFFAVTINDVNAYSYMADKTEIPIDLEISGVEAIEQTDDGYLWIGQYSGLTRYDSKEFVDKKILYAVSKNGIDTYVIKEDVKKEEIKKRILSSLLA